MNDNTTAPEDNRLLALLSPEGLDRVRAERVWLRPGKIVLPADENIQYVYFPTTAVISVVGQTSEGKMFEVGLCGREGVAGAAAILGATSSPLDRTVQIPGEAFRAPLSKAKAEFEHCAKFRGGLMMFLQEWMHEMALTVICSRFHAVEQRFARWLLMRHDRLGDGVIPITHECIAQMTGTNRSTITIIATRMQELGYIKYAWGKLAVADRRGLEKLVCECYPVKTLAASS